MIAGLRLDGALLLRSEFTEGWAYESPPYDDLVALLSPGARRLILFHIVATGACTVSGADDALSAVAGDVVVVPYADQHVVGGRDPAQPAPIGDLLGSPPWERLPVIRHGGGGDVTTIVCGYLQSDHPLFDPALRALPPVMVIRASSGAARRWVDASIEYALEQSGPSGRAAPVVTRLAELLLVELLRGHLGGTQDGQARWLGSLGDPVIARAMALIHGDPARAWTVGDLARETHVSRSALDERFRDRLGISPIRYLTDWRMRVAADLLRTGDHPMLQVAHRVGYGSEAAFSRAFKRAHGVAPSAWRSAVTSL